MQIRAREGDAVRDPVDVARQRAAGAAQALQTRIAAERGVALGERGVAVRIRAQEAAQRQDASSWGPQFVNNGITAYRAQRPAGIVHADRAAAEAAHRWNGTCWLHHGRVEIGDDRHRQILDLRRVTGGRRRSAAAGVVQSVRTLAPEGFRPHTGGMAAVPRHRRHRGSPAPRVYMPDPVAEVSLATTTCSGNRGEVDAGHCSGRGVITPVRPE